MTDYAAKAMLDSVIYDDDTDRYRIDVRSCKIWFKRAEAGRYDNIILYHDEDTRAGTIVAPPFELKELNIQLELVDRHGDPEVTAIQD